MNVSKLNLQQMLALMGTICVLSTKETIEDISLYLDADSKEKLESILKTGVLTKYNQDLHADTVLIKKCDSNILQKGQSPFVKTSSGYALNSRGKNPAHFSSEFQTTVPSIVDSKIYPVEIKLGNFSFDFSNSKVDESGNDGYILYEDVPKSIK